MNEELVIENTGLIHKAITELNIFWNSDDEYEEINNAGIDGLIIASKNYEDEKGKFSTYAYHCIKNSLLHWVYFKNMQKRVINYQNMARLNEPINNESDNEYIDLIPDEKVDIERQTEIQNQIEEIIDIAKEYTNKDNAEMLKMYFGLYEYKPLSYETIGKFYGLSKTTIRNKIKKTIRIVQLVLKDRNYESKEKQKEIKY